MTEIPNYYAVLSANIRYNKELTLFEKMLYGEITALTNSKGYCFAKNKYFADLYERSSRQISRAFSNLEKNGFIIIENNNETDRKRRIFLTKNIGKNGVESTTPLDKNVYPPRQKCLPPLDKNVYPIYSNNNINNNIREKSIKKEKISPPVFGIKNKYGKYQNVLLTEEEYNRLVAEKNGAMAIDYFSKYLQDKKGYESQNHNLAVRRWVFTAVREKQIKEKKLCEEEKKYCTKDFIKHDYDPAKIKEIGVAEIKF